MPPTRRASLGAALAAAAVALMPALAAPSLLAGAGAPTEAAQARASEPPAPAGSEAVILDTALHTARKLTDPYARADMAVRIGEAYAALGFRARAEQAMDEALSASLESSLRRHLLLQTAEACVRAKLYDRALAMVDLMDYLPHTIQVLCAVADAQARAGLRDDAAAAFRKAEGRLATAQADEPIALGWTRVAEAYARAGMVPQFEAALERATEQVARITNGLTRGMMMETVARVYLQAGRPDDATRIAGAIPAAEVKVPVLTLIAEACAEAGQGAHALDILAEAGQTAAALAEPHRRAAMLTAVANGYTQVGRPDMAIGTLADAERAAARVADPSRGAIAWTRLATAYGAAGDLDAAQRIVRDIDDAMRRSEQFIALALKCARQGQYDQAVRILNRAAPECVALAGDAKLKALGETYYNAWGRAAPQSRIEDLEPSEVRDAVLAHYGEAWSADGDYGKAIAFAQAIAFPVTRDNALHAIAVRCLGAAQSMEAAAPAVKILGLLAGRLDKLVLRSELGAKEADLGLTQEALAALEALEKDVDKEEMPSARAELLGDIALTYHKLGRKEESRAAAAKAIGAALKVACASCRDEVVQDLFEHLSGADYVELAFAAAEQMELPGLRADNFMRMFEMSKGLTGAQNEKLLREALSASTQTPVLPQRIQLLVRAAANYRRAGLAVTEDEQRMLAKSYEQIPVVVEPPRRPAPAPTPQAPPRTHLVYFDKPGCPLCGEVKASFGDLRRMFPNLTIDIYDLATSESANLLNVAICTGLSVPQTQRLVTPSIFSSRSGLVGPEISLAAMAELARGAEGLPSPVDLFGPRKEEARAELERTYEALGLLIVGGAGLIDGVNPCAFTVIIFFLSYLAYLGKDRREIAAAGIVFTIAVFLTYFGAGLVLTEVLDAVASWSRIATKVIYGATALLALVAALLSFRDGLRCLKGQTANLTLSLPDALKTRIRLAISRRARLGLTVAATAVLGVVVALFELPCTGQTYVPTIVFAARHLPQYGWGPLGWLLLYNLCFIVPLVLVFAAVFFGLTSERLTALFRRHIALTKFALTFVFALLCAVMVVYLVQPRLLS